MISPAGWENDLERRVAERYRDEGFDVRVHPSADDLPLDLGGYRPNLIATRGSERLLIAVRGSVMQSSIDRLIEAADRVRTTPWKLLLVTGDDVPGELMPGADLALPEWPEIHHQITKLDGERDGPATLLFAWVVMEAVLRRHALDVSLPIHRLPTSGLIKQLYTQGELPAEPFETLMGLLDQRGRVAHGFSFEAAPGEIEELRATIAELLTFWSEPA